jgi:uncharacterized protein (DUF2252 family)
LIAMAVLGACGTGDDPRADFVVNTLAEDNYAWARRDPAVVAMKLTKMQRDPYIWLRGTPAVFWRDVTDPGAARAVTAFGSPAASRVLLVADPHPENLGSFRASDGTMFLDWNDFDSAGYGPFEGDVRRLAAGMIVASHDAADPASADAVDPAYATELARRVAIGYATQMAALAAGQPAQPVTTGAAKYLDKLFAKASSNGDARKELTDATEVVDGVRVFLTGDLDPVADDGVIETRQTSVTPEERDRVIRALARYLVQHPELGTLVSIVRRYGSGVSSYAALRYYVLFASDRIVEVKEERDGLVIHGVPELAAAEWTSPSVRAVDAQRRLQLRRDADELLGAADVLPLAFRVHDHASYQRGVNASDLGALAIDPGKASQVTDLAEIFGALLARAHGVARTADGVAGWTVIAPLLGDGAGFADEVVALARTDAAQVISDWKLLRTEDLGARVLPARSE